MNNYSENNEITKTPVSRMVCYATSRKNFDNLLRWITRGKKVGKRRRGRRQISRLDNLRKRFNTSTIPLTRSNRLRDCQRSLTNFGTRRRRIIGKVKQWIFWVSEKKNTSNDFTRLDFLVDPRLPTISNPDRRSRLRSITVNIRFSTTVYSHIKQFDYTNDYN